MNKLKKFFKETIRESLKDNLKKAIVYILLLLVGIVPKFIKQINSVEITINLTIIITFVFFVTILIINLFILKKGNIKLKTDYEELLNPANENANNFMQGDVVILKTEKESSTPQKLSVVRITNSEIICRNRNGKLIKYSPEELLTNIDTNEVFQRIKYQKQKTEQENQEFFDSFNKW